MDDQLAPSPPLDAGVDIGHVHLKVSDLDRSVAFYRDVLGLTVQGRMGDRLRFAPPAMSTTITSD